MNTIELNKLYTLDNYNTIEVIKKTKHFITYRTGKLKKVEDENYIYNIYGEKTFGNHKTKLFVKDEGNNIYIKDSGFPSYFKTDKPILTYSIFDDTRIIERNII